MTQLELTHITQSYREAGSRLLAIQDVSLSVAAGEFVTIIGPSGCGKSTLLEVIAGLQQPDSGTIILKGESLSNRLGRTAYMPQQDALLPWRTVLNNVILGQEVGRGHRRQAKQRAQELLPLFGLEGFAHSFPTQLSGGMRQRAALLRTFLMGKDILLLDEPFGALDAITRHELQAWLLQVWGHFGYTIVFVTHDVEEAITLSDRVIVLSTRPGHVVMEVAVPFARPRDADAMRYSPEMTALETQLYQALRHR
ncbi:MAG: ABC transporter ATP-binding protein [Anaerolineales bacterium]|nr:ABC transporter ATP-binding protein [Anaerolineales bacterium]